MSLVLGFTTLTSSKICDEFTVGGRKVCVLRRCSSLALENVGPTPSRRKQERIPD
jgi:hypothetical protein